MFPIVLVLLVATSALAAPSVNVEVRSINDIIPLPNNGRLFLPNLISRALEIVDGGDTNVYTAAAIPGIYDLASLPDRYSQALAVAQTIAILRQHTTGVPGDACASANLIDAYARYLQTGNVSNLLGAFRNFVQSVLSSIDQIVTLANNPNSVRFAVGPRGNCNAGGRIYPFETVWEVILASVKPSQANLVNEQYCAAKRLFNAFDVRSNNDGAAITAFSLPPVTSLCQLVVEPLTELLRAITTGNAAAGRAAAVFAKTAIINAVPRVHL